MGHVVLERDLSNHRFRSKSEVHQRCEPSWIPSQCAGFHKEGTGLRHRAPRRIENPIRHFPSELPSDTIF